LAIEWISTEIQPGLCRGIDRFNQCTASSQIFEGLADKQKDFISFVLSKYIETGVGELEQEKLPSLLELKYQSITDATEMLGGVDSIRTIFVEFQKYLYQIQAA
jgi:type I restriction enzyme R subunit